MSHKTSIQKTDAMTVALHWALVGCLIFSLITGLRIASDSTDSVFAKAMSDLLLQGDVFQWHIWSAYGLILIIAGYSLFIMRAKLTQRLAVDNARLRALKSSDSSARWKAINILIFWFAFALIIAITITGTALYFFADLVPFATIAWLHQIVAWMIIAYIVIHIVTQLMQGGLKQIAKIMNPKLAYGGAAFLAISATAVASIVVTNLDRLNIDTLAIKKTTNAPKIDGNAGDAAWQTADVIRISTNRGVNNPDGHVSVDVKMLHDGNKLYSLFRWPDSTHSQKHLPLQKTENGWVVLQSEYGIQDEDDYYEDKFAVMFSHQDMLAGSGATHMGPKPLAEKPGPAGGRGLHYTVDDSIVDVWHWKSVRTGSVAMNQIDDNYFGPPMEPNPKKKRYTGGYTQDPHTGGGYSMNWETFSDDGIRPKRLPKLAEQLAPFQKVNLDPTVGDDVAFYMHVDDTIEYSEELDTYPIGTVMPSVLIKGPRLGDRGHVTAISRWQDGWWTLEVVRDMDTGSKYDINFASTSPMYMWVAVFDHTQTRHNQHLHPVRLAMELDKTAL